MKVEHEDERVQLPASAVEPEYKPTKQARSRWWIAILAAVIVAVVFVSGVLPRVTARTTLRRETDQLAVPTVNVIRPRQTTPSQEIVLPANVQPYINAPIYARTNGYLKRWYADIGARVKKGQLLAEIETPEIDQQLLQARANLATAQANLKLSETTATRYQDLLKSDSVSQQETDNAVGIIPGSFPYHFPFLSRGNHTGNFSNVVLDRSRGRRSPGLPAWSDCPTRCAYAGGCASLRRRIFAHGDD